MLCHEDSNAGCSLGLNGKYNEYVAPVVCSHVSLCWCVWRVYPALPCVSSCVMSSTLAEVGLLFLCSLGCLAN